MRYYLSRAGDKVYIPYGAVPDPGSANGWSLPGQESATEKARQDKVKGGGLVSSSVSVAFAGKRPAQATAQAAVGSAPLDQPQAAMAIGEAIPIIHCRRRGNVGGVLVFPKATECRFENDDISVFFYYHCVLGDGPMGSIQVRDFRIGGCRRGIFSQNYNKRAGDWDPGNFVIHRGYDLPEFPNYTGGGGDYAGLSTLEFSLATGRVDDGWKDGCSCFIRDGRIYERGRLLDAVVGSSDNVADLVLHAIERSSRVPAGLIDIPSFQAAALFTEANGFWFNGEIREAGNLGDWLVRILPLFLLRQTKVAGKIGLRPLLPANDDGTINTGRLSADWMLTETSIVPGSFQQTYSNDSQAPNYQAIWRQQQDDIEPPIPRALEVGPQAAAAPVESLDLSLFCTTELHAARAGHYQRACRYLRTHSATVKLRPGAQSGYAGQGDIVQVKLTTQTTRAVAVINEWYQIASIGRSLAGDETWQLDHFPVDEQGRSLLALAVAEATVPGVILPSQGTASCDEFERDKDNSSPTPIDPKPRPAVPPFSRPTGEGGKGGGFDKSETPDRSPEAAPPPNGGGKETTPPGQGDRRCPLGYVGVNFGITYAYLTGPNQVASGTISVTGAKSWPIIFDYGDRTQLAGHYIYTYQVQYQDSAGVPQFTTFTDLRAVPNFPTPGYTDHPYNITVEDFECSGPTPIYDREAMVRPGDTLHGIAQRVLGDSTRWPEILNANRNEIKDPNLIFPGQWLRIPSAGNSP